MAILATKKNKIQDSAEDKVLYAVVNTFLIVFMLVVAYPLIFVLSSSFSSGEAVSAGRVLLWPVDFSVRGYEAVFKHKNILTGYRNTLLYTVIGTMFNIAVTMICAYPLSRRDMQWKRFYMIIFVITMYFGGGLIPTYIVINKLGLINTFWVMVVPGLMGVYNMIVARTFIMSTIPLEVLESAQIDGCSDVHYFFRIVLPLSKAIIAVMGLFYGVGHWNAYFNAMIYLSEPKRYPLQLILRQILVLNQINYNDMMDPELIAANIGMADLLKYSLIVVATLPILAIYPFAQKYFIKGIMVGSLKG
ncbi:MAG: carbohydrate ABC transporter permease [Clostridiaceae bacterium]|jgi:multiple sugar transport system permease protein/putative aldouronate transport system permease protein|nr:carbohydrate ABC transporter permease [Clostridiaceae bacterium]